MARNANQGLMATFDTPAEIYHACERLHAEGFTRWDSFTPYPVHGLDKASGLPRSKVPFFTFVGGVAGFALGVLIVWYQNAFDYPLIVGGKPYFSFIFPFPIFYELTILLAAFGTLFGMFLTNALPRHNHPVFNYPHFPESSDDKFMIYVDEADAHYDREQTANLLASLGGYDVHYIGPQDAVYG